MSSTPTLKLYYKEWIEVPSSNVKLETGIGAGKDYDGFYDSGSSRVTTTCTACGSYSHMKSNSIEDAIKGHLLFKVYKKD